MKKDESDTAAPSDISRGRGSGREAILKETSYQKLNIRSNCSSACGTKLSRRRMRPRWSDAPAAAGEGGLHSRKQLSSGRSSG